MTRVKPSKVKPVKAPGAVARVCSMGLCTRREINIASFQSHDSDDMQILMEGRE